MLSPDQLCDATAGDPESCPVCAEPRAGVAARYCDNCRYDFLNREPFAAGSATAAPSGGPIRWHLAMTVDAARHRPGDPAPPDTGDCSFALDGTDHLIGRQADGDGARPEIAVPDRAVSRRHACLIRQPDGTMVLVDLGSMNGTRVNGAALEPNVPAPVVAGDQITLGSWTLLTLRTT